MGERAKITAVEALQEFRTELLVYLGKARPALDEASSEVSHMRRWLETDRRDHWESELRRRRRKLEEAEASLFSSRMSKFQETSGGQQATVQRARREVTEAEEKLRTIKRWARDFDNRTLPLLKQQEKLSSVLGQDVPNAAAHLAGIIDTLQKYAMIEPPGAADATVAAPAEKGQQ
jgi:hypothetical protein